MVDKNIKKRGKSKISCNFFQNKKGVSPVIATVLLISMVIIIGIIIFLWFRGMVGETVTKFGKNIELACEDVVFDASYSGETLFITNDGAVPIYDMNVKIEGAGSHDTEKLSEPTTSSWRADLGDNGLIQGGVFESDVAEAQGATSITLIPILLGNTDGGENKEFVCDEGQFGIEINLEE